MLARGYRKEKWFYEVAKNLLAPDVIFLAYVPAERAIERIKSRPSECDRFLDEELLKKVSGEFLRLSKSENFERIETRQVEEKSFEKVKETLIGRGI